MFVIRKALVFLNPILFIIGLEVVFRNKDYWWIALVVSIVLLLLTIWDFTKRKLNFRFLNFLLSPLLFLLISYWFIFFINTELYFRLIYSVVALFQLVLLDQVLNYFYFASKYQPYTLENLVFYQNLLAGFFIFSSLFSTMIFLRLNIFILLFIVYTLSLAMIYSIYWSHKIIWAKSKLFIFIVPLILLELFWAVSYLPFNYYVNGILMAVFLYVLVGLGKLFLQESLNKKQIINYLVVAVISIILIVFSAQWS